VAVGGEPAGEIRGDVGGKERLKEREVEAVRADGDAEGVDLAPLDTHPR
jgi:hypothetical protein